MENIIMIMMKWQPMNNDNNERRNVIMINNNEEKWNDERTAIMNVEWK